MKLTSAGSSQDIKLLNYMFYSIFCVLFSHQVTWQILKRFRNRLVVPHAKWYWMKQSKPIGQVTTTNTSIRTLTKLDSTTELRTMKKLWKFGPMQLMSSNCKFTFVENVFCLKLGLGRMLKKEPGLKFSSLHLSVLWCNCWTYDDNIGTKLFIGSMWKLIKF